MTPASELMLSLGLSAPKRLTYHKQTWNIVGSSIYNHSVQIRRSLSEITLEIPIDTHDLQTRSTECSLSLILDPMYEIPQVHSVHCPVKSKINLGRENNR